MDVYPTSKVKRYKEEEAKLDKGTFPAVDSSNTQTSFLFTKALDPSATPALGARNAGPGKLCFFWLLQP